MVEGKDLDLHKKAAKEVIARLLKTKEDKRLIEHEIDSLYRDISVSTLLNVIDNIPESKVNKTLRLKD